MSYVLLLQVIVCCFYLLYHGYLAPGRIPFHLYRPQDIYTGYCYIPWYSLRRTMESTEHSINIQYTETTGYWRLKSRPPPQCLWAEESTKFVQSPASGSKEALKLKLLYLVYRNTWSGAFVIVVSSGTSVLAPGSVHSMDMI